MRLRPLLAAVVLAAVIGGAASSATAASGTKTITVGDQDTVTASVSNPLDITDVLTVSFDGPAATNGIVSFALPAEREGVTCNTAQNTCEVVLKPGAEKDLSFTVEGEKPGSDMLMVSVSSRTTGKRADADMKVVVKREGGGLLTFLTRLIGIS